MPLFSIQLNSNRPAQFQTFLDAIERTVDVAQDVEVLVHIDQGDEAMAALVAHEKVRRPFSLRSATTNLVRGYATLWKPLNILLQMTSPDAYFVINLSDEMHFATKGWDTIVRRYVGYYPDHVFRLRASKYRFRNYTDYWECGFAPDSCAFYTRKWLELSGDWNPCLGPDSFQQCIAFYLFTSDLFSQVQYNRDIPLMDVHFTGEGAGLDLKGRARLERLLTNNRAWFVLMSHGMQQEAKRRAMRIKSHILVDELGGASDLRVVDDSVAKRFLIIRDDATVPVRLLSYRLSWLRITSTNIARMPWVLYYAGGGKRVLRYPFNGILIMMATYLPKGIALLEVAYSAVEAPRRVKKSVRSAMVRAARTRFGRWCMIVPLRAWDSVLSRFGERRLRPAPRRVPIYLPNDSSEPIGDGVLFSVQLSSTRPHEVMELLNNIEQTADDPSCVEVLIHVDAGDRAMTTLLEREKGGRRLYLQYLEATHVDGCTVMWKSHNPLFRMTNPSAYFVTLLSDHIRFASKGWDTELRRYIATYPDHVFRVRCSKYRFRNYTDLSECALAPDSPAFYTRRWLEIQGGWNPCIGPDSFQQCVAFYLFTSTPWSHTQYHRDIVAPFLTFAGESAARGIKEETRKKRIRDNNREWDRVMSHPMQENAKRRAMLLKACILRQEALEVGQNVQICDDTARHSIIVQRNVDGRDERLDYHVSRMKSACQIVFRAATNGSLARIRRQRDRPECGLSGNPPNS